MNRRAVRNSLAQSLVVGIPGPEAGAAELDLAGHEGLGGVILFARNVESPAQVWQLCYDLRRAAAEAERPSLLMLVDQEGGSVARLRAPFTDGPDLADLGPADEAALRAHGARMGRELVAAGFNWDMAPVLDVHALANGIMARRSLGSDPERVARLGAAFISGMQQTGCLACAKHFPGLGRTTLDTHQERPVVELTRDQLAAVEWPPFAAAAQAGVAGVMICHAVYNALDPARPASLSPKVIQDLLRGELGYTGMVLSDDLEMGAVVGGMAPEDAVVEAYAAGCDLILMCSKPELALAGLEKLTALVMAGEIDPALVAQRAQRIVQLKQGLAPLPPDLHHLRAVLAGNQGAA
ncbi:MAG: beta-N-acetylhexosaminidase [Desulfarculaceae bacterium]|nr:beta-N-acetylhexosaminidase [Desulfarculaceae bacterium]MCF8070980.1 beta-N-acetylhexosaminidase [Desulfarculaceae bacterium]MCF8100568.1 beta-N-acetylhexosaminidase [Desulfarculaceae bacterium]MCF8116594.1 beta-N-acetylhexosaminidase [Desulfarculaceae bacterium]